MKKTFFLLILLIVLPLAVVIWLSLHWSVEQKKSLESNYRQTVTESLDFVSKSLESFFEQKQRDLALFCSKLSNDKNQIRTVMRQNGLIEGIVIWGSNGKYVYPQPGWSDLSKNEKKLLEITQTWFGSPMPTTPIPKEYGRRETNETISSRNSFLGNSKVKVNKPKRDQLYSSLSKNKSVLDVSKSRNIESSGLDDKPISSDHEPIFQAEQNPWRIVYWDNEMSWFYIFRSPSGNHIGLEILSIRMMAELLNVIPQLDLEKEKYQLILRDPQGDIFYQYGYYPTEKNERAIINYPLKHPLKGYVLSFYGPQNKILDQLENDFKVNLSLGLIVFILVFCLIIIIFFREQRKVVQEALQKVSFVNQVSHELKTPLTNIRMYAEMLKEYCFDEDSKEESYSKVIILESQRLSRIIESILTYSKHQRKKLKLRYREISIGEIVDLAITPFIPSLEQREIKLEIQAPRDLKIKVDSDFYSQIIGNLLSNIEKYAANGKVAFINITHHEDKLITIVEDRGPGIPKHLRLKIFEPFYRVSNQLSEGVSGTGIGLSICKELAQLHGGSISVEQLSVGLRFTVTLKSKIVQ